MGLALDVSGHSSSPTMSATCNRSMPKSSLLELRIWCVWTERVSQIEQLMSRDITPASVPGEYGWFQTLRLVIIIGDQGLRSESVKCAKAMLR